MRATVTLPAALRAQANDLPNQPLDLEMPDEATVGDLVDELAARFDGVFNAEAGGETQNAARECLRIFVDGKLADRADAPLAPPGTTTQNILVMLIYPIQGGA